MGRRGWIIAIVAAVAGAAILIAVLASGDSQEEAQGDVCTSLTSLESSLQELQALEPTSASQEDYDAAVSAIGDDWDEVKSSTSELAEATRSELESAGDDFTSAVDDVPDDASVTEALGEVGTAAQTFASTVQATLTGPDCASS